MTEKLSLELGRKTCQIIIGRGILGDIGGLAPRAGRFVIITNPTVGSLYGEVVARSLGVSGSQCEIFLVPDSESSKSLDAANDLYSRLSDAGFDRQSCIIGLGGGVVGDLAGFVAATYMRGIDLIQMPTTLLAQTDSAIGGKTGVNIPSGKNLVGAFHQPAMIISDVSVLDTLSDREFLSGLAEMVKYGVIASRDLFSKLGQDRERIFDKGADALENLVTECSRIKCRIVEEDERDVGKRTTLNLGHTLGHALESASGYGYSHGEGVAIGMVFAARISVKLGLMTEAEQNTISDLLASIGLPIRIENRMDEEKLLRFMMADKKCRSGKVRMVLPTGIGREPVCDEVDRELLLSMLKGMMA